MVKSVFPRDSLAQAQDKATSIMEEAQIYVGFTLKSLSKEAQAVASRNDSLAIQECTQFDQTAMNQSPMIEESNGLD
ncbi:hypothetical protein Tco_0627706 [Tanacetum coccineum]|uniref:Uncharacterized protein n=1 Tax=Tanacetum coccineum TaxID=301880 RepID=A0ABQ4WN72_9ASTR